MLLPYVILLEAEEIKSQVIDAKLSNGKCISKEICKITILSTSATQSINHKIDGEKIQANFSYNNSAIYLEPLGVLIYKSQESGDEVTLSNISKRKAQEMLLEHQDNFFKDTANEPYGAELIFSMNVSYFDSSYIFIDYNSSYSFSSANHPSFWYAGVIFNIKNKALQFLTLKDVIQDNIDSKKFLATLVEEHICEIDDNCRSTQAALKTYFYEDGYNSSLWNQPIVLREDSLYINLRRYLGEAGRSLDDFTIDYKRLKPFAKGILKHIINKQSL